MTRSLNVTSKTTERHLVVRSGKPEAEITIIKDCARCITLLKLTTDRHKASRGLSATAWLLFYITFYTLLSSASAFHIEENEVVGPLAVR